MSMNRPMEYLPLLNLRKEKASKPGILKRIARILKRIKGLILKEGGIEN